MKRKSILIACLLVAAIFTQACTDANLKKVAQASNDCARGIQVALALNKQLIKQELVSKDDAIIILNGLLDLDRLLRELNSTALTYGKIDAVSKAALLNIINSITISLANLQQQGVLKIKNPDSQAQFTAALAIVSGAVGVLQGLLGGVK